ncbi:TPA: replication regulatory protein RepA [Escherichia coli]|uniref:replication regulatory protein RepA n=1 Tax=Escherichia coli TaxID=562 RepID=UPI001080AD97|nr:replication regulatory protein RepA [Escherichia coli]HDQ6587212.1 replication regulatory protein RepA [Escherichia coli O187:H28]EFI5800628.1 replication regulatory protein RepA [Escherichia coli]EFM3830430.1 replication regulatory protein RepA [Escherichia coli]EFN1897477.1 replication regulatory protein RepA [Escherichia coli]EJS1806576.1 replication regulatory protein RepA [Escherichia coli]
MSQTENAVTSSLSQKRFVRRSKPMSDSEKQMAAVARKRLTHKEIKVFVKNPLKDLMVEYCEQKGITQAQFIEKIIKDELQRLDVLK